MLTIKLGNWLFLQTIYTFTCFHINPAFLFIVWEKKENRQSGFKADCDKGSCCGCLSFVV